MKLDPFFRIFVEMNEKKLLTRGQIGRIGGRWPTQLIAFALMMHY